jgi:hypothetical protein
MFNSRLFLQPAVQTAAAQALALAVDQKLGSFNGGLGRAIQIDEKTSSVIPVTALAVPASDPGQLTFFQELFPLIVEQILEFGIGLVQLFVRLEINLIQTVQAVKIIPGVIAIGIRQDKIRQQNTEQHQHAFHIFLHLSSPFFATA